MHAQLATTLEQSMGDARRFSLRDLFVMLVSAAMACAWIRAWGSGNDLLLVAAGACWHGAARGLCWTDLRRGSRTDVAWESICQAACLGLGANMVVYAVLAWKGG